MPKSDIQAIFILFAGEVCLLELEHRNDDTGWRSIAKRVWLPPPGPLPAESSPSVHGSGKFQSNLTLPTIYRLFT